MCTLLEIIETEKHVFVDANGHPRGHVGSVALISASILRQVYALGLLVTATDLVGSQVCCEDASTTLGWRTEPPNRSKQVPAQMIIHVSISLEVSSYRKPRSLLQQLCLHIRGVIHQGRFGRRSCSECALPDWTEMVIWLWVNQNAQRG